jgi:hypothetical protein
MQKLLDSLEALRQSDDSFRQAVENILVDMRSEANPYGNLAPDLVVSLDECSNGSKPVEDVIQEHQFLKKPEMHRSSEVKPMLRRAMAWRWFITYQVLSGSATDESEIDAWRPRLEVGSRCQLFIRTLLGRTGKEGQPCWWTFDLPGCAVEEDGWCYALQLALGPSDLEQAQLDEKLVEVSIAGESVGELYKPTALEGFGPNTLFRPHLTDVDYGLTAPRPGQEGRPEVVSASQAYHEVAGTTREIEVRVLPYKPK